MLGGNFFVILNFGWGLVDVYVFGSGFNFSFVYIQLFISLATSCLTGVPRQKS